MKYEKYPVTGWDHDVLKCANRVQAARKKGTQVDEVARTWLIRFRVAGWVRIKISLAGRDHILNLGQ
jgi:hypothetical protein